MLYEDDVVDEMIELLMPIPLILMGDLIPAGPAGTTRPLGPAGPAQAARPSEVFKAAWAAFT